jgi:hypothetical protein
MTTILPTLELKHNKETTSSSTNTNTINNNIIIKPTLDETFKNLEENIVEIPPEISTSSIVKKSDTPQNISEFKEALIAVLILYFKNNVVLFNNLIELSNKIITKTDDLRLLIAFLLSIPKADMQVEVEEITMKVFCGTMCKKIPRYRKVKDVIINKKQSFEVSYNQYYIQTGMEFNISLEYILL